MTDTPERIKVADATAAQLRAFATVQLGIDAAPTTNKGRIKALMDAAGYAEDTIPNLSFARPATEPAAPAAPVPDEDHGEPWAEIVLASESSTGGDRPHPVSVNGVCIFIPRGEPVMVKQRYVEALVGATYSVPVKDENHQIQEFRDSPRFSVQVLGWHKSAKKTAA